jgi:hypothetical protein
MSLIVRVIAEVCLPGVLHWESPAGNGRQRTQRPEHELLGIQ